MLGSSLAASKPRRAAGCLA